MLHSNAFVGGDAFTGPRISRLCGLHER